MESSQADNRPNREETNEHNNHSEGRLLYYFEDLLFRFHHCSTRYLHLNGHYRVLYRVYLHKTKCVTEHENINTAKNANETRNK